MFELNKDGAKAIMPINDMANICGHFQSDTSVNNGYGCNHCEEFGVEYDEGEYIVTDEQEILDKLSESE